MRRTYTAAYFSQLSFAASASARGFSLFARAAPRRCERRLDQVCVHKGASPSMMHLAVGISPAARLPYGITNRECSLDFCNTACDRATLGSRAWQEFPFQKKEGFAKGTRVVRKCRGTYVF